MDLDIKKPSDLNDSQWQAVISKARHLLIVAGPGTGKTHTLTYRIACQAGRLPPGQKILAITFTNKAAGEMRERLSGRIANSGERIMVGTFHQFCLFLLREYHREARLPKDFTIASPQEVEGLARNLWPDKKRKELKLLMEDISRYKSVRFEEPAPRHVMECNRCFSAKGLLDFDDLLLNTLKLLGDQETVLRKVQSAYQDIFIDEYQDINKVQQALIKLLLGEQGRITAIGDPNQAIYGFRGCDVKFFESFKEDFSPAEVLSLSDNYRSAPNLLCASGQVMAKTEGMPVAPLTAKIYREGRLVIHESATDKAEAEFVVHEIEKLIGGTSMFSQDSGRVASEEEGQYGFSDVAVLYRLNSQRFALKEAFDRLGIPYRVSGEETSQENQEIIDDVLPRTIVEVEIEAEKVSLMSLHAAKGLEFPVVFIIGCEENIIPLNIEGLKGDEAEERRLFYVGMTRAKERLYLIRARRRRLYGKRYEQKPSPFISDIEENLKEYGPERLNKRKRKKTDQQLSLFEI